MIISVKSFFQYVVIGIMAVIATLRVDTVETMTCVTIWQASVLEDVRSNGRDIGVMVGLTVGMSINPLNNIP